MKRVLAIIIILICLSLSSLFIIYPKEEFSSDENRFLESIPKFNIDNLITGKYTSKISNYIADHFPFRKKFLAIKTRSDKLLGVRKQSDVYYGIDNNLYQEYQKPKNSDYIIKKINEFSEKQNKNNINMYFMLVPTSIYINDDKISKYNTNYDEGLTIDYYKDNLIINFIDVRKIFEENSEKQLYYKTDHHWTTLGASYAYLTFCDNLNIDKIDYNLEIVNDKFYGTLYSKVIDDTLEYDIIEKIKDNGKYSVYYDDANYETDKLYNDKYLNEKDKYSFFLDGNHSLITIDNQLIDNNSNILVIKDSYANCFIPFIVRHYDKVHIIDPRYYKKNIQEYIEKNNINTILFLYNVMTIDNDEGIFNIK